MEKKSFLDVKAFSKEHALQHLHQVGAEVIIKECRSKKGVEDADCLRVIRQKNIGTNDLGKPVIELTISGFKTEISKYS